MLLLNLLLWGLRFALASRPSQEHAYPDTVGRSIAVSLIATTTTPPQRPDFTFEQLYGLQRKFLDNFIYPNNANQVGLSFLIHPLSSCNRSKADDGDGRRKGSIPPSSPKMS